MPCSPSNAAQQASYSRKTGTESGLGPPAKFNLRFGDEIAELRVFDATGRRLDTACFLYEMQTFDAESWPTLPTGTVPKADALPLLEAVLYGPRDERLDSTQLVRSLPETYLHPERFEPLDALVKPALSALARRTGMKGRVALVPDGLFLAARSQVMEDLLYVPGFRKAHFGRAGFESKAELGCRIRGIAHDRSIDPVTWPDLHFALYSPDPQPVLDRYLAPLRRLGSREFRNASGISPYQLALLAAARQATGASRERSSPLDRLLVGVVRGESERIGGRGVPDLSDAFLRRRDRADRPRRSLPAELPAALVHGRGGSTSTANGARPSSRWRLLRGSAGRSESTRTSRA